MAAALARRARRHRGEIPAQHGLDGRAEGRHRRGREPPLERQAIDEVTARSHGLHEHTEAAVGVHPGDEGRGRRRGRARALSPRRAARRASCPPGRAPVRTKGTSKGSRRPKTPEATSSGTSSKVARPRPGRRPRRREQEEDDGGGGDSQATGHSTRVAGLDDAGVVCRLEGAMERSEIVLHGHRVSYRMAGRGPLLVLLHGIAGSSATWDEVFPRLGESHTVLAPDLLGHGESGEAGGGLLARGVRERRPRPSRGARAAARDDRRALARGRRRDAARLPVPRALRAPRAGFERRPRPRAPRDAARGGAARGRGGAPLALRGGAAQRRRMVHALGSLGLRASADLEETWRSFVSLEEPEARQAFLRTVRGLIDLHGQRVSATDRLYLTAELPTLIVWGALDPLIPVRHAHEAHAEDRGKPPRDPPGRRPLPAPRRSAALRLGSPRLRRDDGAPARRPEAPAPPAARRPAADAPGVQASELCPARMSTIQDP